MLYISIYCFFFFLGKFAKLGLPLLVQNALFCQLLAIMSEMHYFNHKKYIPSKIFLLKKEIKILKKFFGRPGIRAHNPYVSGYLVANHKVGAANSYYYKVCTMSICNQNSALDKYI